MSIQLHTGLEGYLLLFGWVFAEQIGLPLPAAPVLVAAGALAATGSLNFALLISTALSASLLADSLWYRAGVSRQDAVNRFKLRHQDSHVLRSAERLIERYGSRSLIFAKFVPGMSLAAPPLSGTCGIKLSEFLLFDVLGALIWSASLAGIGYFSGSTIKSGSIQVSAITCLLLCAAVAIGFAGTQFARPAWNKLSKRSFEAAVASRVSSVYKDEPLKLHSLTRLITGGAVSEPVSIQGAVLLTGVGNPSFAAWFAAWSRRLEIARALGRVAVELKDSVRRVELVDQTEPRTVVKRDWRRLCSANRVHIEDAIEAVDLFPRCALLLTSFEKLSLMDAAILLGVRKETAAKAQAIGLKQLSRILAGGRGTTELLVQSDPKLEKLRRTA